MLNKIELLISNALSDSYISHTEFISIINVLKEYEYIKDKVRKSNKKYV